MSDPTQGKSAAPQVFPVGLKLGGRLCLVVGSSDEARARALALAAAGASVRLVSRTAFALGKQTGAERIEVRKGEFEPSDLDGAWLAVLADRDAELAAALAREAEARRVFFCAVDQSEVGSFSHLGIARAGPLFAAVGSQGEAPALSRRLRQLLEEAFRRAGLAEFAERLAELRRGTPPERRREVLNHAADRLRLDGGFAVSEADEDSVEGGRPARDGERRG